MEGQRQALDKKEADINYLRSRRTHAEDEVRRGTAVGPTAVGISDLGISCGRERSRRRSGDLTMRPRPSSNETSPHPRRSEPKSIGPWPATNGTGDVTVYLKIWPSLSSDRQPHFLLNAAKAFNGWGWAFGVDTCNSFDPFHHRTYHPQTFLLVPTE